MKKAKVLQLLHLRDKGEAKIYMVIMDGGDSGEYYSPKGEPSFKVGDEVEYSIEASDFGPKFKLGGAKKPFGGGGFKKSPEEGALITASGLIKSLIESNQVKLEDYKQHLAEAHAVCLTLMTSKAGESTDKPPF